MDVYVSERFGEAMARYLVENEAYVPFDIPRPAYPGKAAYKLIKGIVTLYCPRSNTTIDIIISKYCNPISLIVEFHSTAVVR